MYPNPVDDQDQQAQNPPQGLRENDEVKENHLSVGVPVQNGQRDVPVENINN